MLHNFWEQRSRSDGSPTGSYVSAGDKATKTDGLLLYESAPTPGPPFVCYVTLPGGSCFGNYKVCWSSSRICYWESNQMECISCSRWTLKQSQREQITLLNPPKWTISQLACMQSSELKLITETENIFFLIEKFLTCCHDPVSSGQLRGTMWFGINKYLQSANLTGE